MINNNATLKKKKSLNITIDVERHLTYITYEWEKLEHTIWWNTSHLK